MTGEKVRAIRRHVLGKYVGPRVAAQHRPGPGIRQGLVDPFCRCPGIEGELDGPTLGQREPGPDLPGTAVDDGSHHSSRFDPFPLQPAGQGVGDFVHLGVGPFLAFPTQGRQLRVTGERRAQGRVQGRGDGRPASRHRLAPPGMLLGGLQRCGSQAAIGILGHLDQEAVQVAGHRGDGGPAEQFRLVFEIDAVVVGVFRDAEGQGVAAAQFSRWQGLQRQPVEFEILGAHVDEADQHVEQRLGLFTDVCSAGREYLLEGGVLVGEDLGRVVACVSHGVAHALAGCVLHAQRQGVDEHPDGVLGACQRPAGQRGPQQEFRLAAEQTQHPGHRGQEHCIGGGPGNRGQTGQGVLAHGAVDRQPVPGERGFFRRGLVVWQLETWRGLGDHVGEEGDVLGEGAGCLEFRHGSHVRGIGQRFNVQLATRPCRGEVLAEHRQRSLVADDVMQFEPQVVLGVADGQHFHAEQRRPGQVERPGLSGEPPPGLLRRHTFVCHDIGDLGVDVHHEVGSLQVEGSTQLIVAAHQRRTGPSEPVDVEVPRDLVVDGHVVGGRVVSHRAERIDSALGGGCGEQPVHRFDGEFRGVTPHDRSGQPGPQRTEGRGGEDVANAQGLTCGLLDQGTQVYGGQGVASAGEEVIRLLRYGADDLGPGSFQGISCVLRLSRAGGGEYCRGGGSCPFRGSRHVVEAYIRWEVLRDEGITRKRNPATPGVEPVAIDIGTSNPEGCQQGA